MSIDYEQLRTLVKEAMFTSGGINEPSAPEGVPHRMPAADTDEKEQDMGDPEANEKYDICLAAREATEKLVEALDQPLYDGAYEHAFKATRALGEALNELVAVGAHPMPDQRVVALPPDQQKYTGGGSGGDYAGGMGIAGGDGFGGFQEATAPALKGFGQKMTSQSQQAQKALARSKEISSGTSLGGVDSKERGMLTQIQDVLTKVAEEGDLSSYRSTLETVLQRLLQSSEKKGQAK
jgi:hypothetical protein